MRVKFIFSFKLKNYCSFVVCFKEIRTKTRKSQVNRSMLIRIRIKSMLKVKFRSKEAKEYEQK